MTLRCRILPDAAPPLLLLLAGAGRRRRRAAPPARRAASTPILRENYDSVLAMERLNEALERIDSSFQFALAGREDEAAQPVPRRAGRPIDEQLGKEKDNITTARRSRTGRPSLTTTQPPTTGTAGDAFYARPPRRARRTTYFGTAGEPGCSTCSGRSRRRRRRDPADQPGEHGAGQPRRPRAPPRRRSSGSRAGLARRSCSSACCRPGHAVRRDPAARSRR